MIKFMKNKYITLLAAGALLQIAIIASAETENNPYPIQTQPKVIQDIINTENSVYHSKGLLRIVTKLDNMYGNLYEQIKSGSKIRIYIDPAHGKLNGTWRGMMSGRYCVHGKPEEYYSIMLLRELYKNLSKNPHIEIVTPEDHLHAMQGKSDSYNDITFKESIRRAFDTNCQIIISQHLNNVAMFHKASGTSNISGIHIVNGGGGRRYLTNIQSVFRGFLTLYNKLDVSGFSKNYAFNLRKSLLGCGLTPNNWDRGAVADDRFEYFVDFPISLIYETGFISNPDDLKNITSPEIRERNAKAQYDTLIESMKNIFCVDISGSVVQKCPSPDSTFDLTLLKLSRISLYYLRYGKPQKACHVIDVMNRHYGQSRFKDHITPYLHMKNRTNQAERYYSKAKYYLKKPARNAVTKRRYICEAKRYLCAAKNIARIKPYYYGLYRRYDRRYTSLLPAKIIPIPTISKAEPKQISGNIVIRRNSPGYEKAERAPVSRPIILVINNEHDLADALHKAIDPDPETMTRLLEKFNNAATVKWVKKRTWSRKKRRMVTTWHKVKQEIIFNCGIYIVTLDRNLAVTSAKKVSKVSLDGNRYQNHLYLKNSHFAHVQRDKSL